MGVIFGPRCHSYGITGYGNPDDGVVIVGIAPGKDEAERTHRPFTGASGQLLDSLLTYSGWSRDRVYTTNTICWWNNAPDEADLAACRERFQRELSSLKPRLIITAGEIAHDAVIGMKRKPGSRGSVVWSKRWNCYVLDTHHPSYVLQSRQMSPAQDIIRDLSKIPDILEWPPEEAIAAVSYHAIASVQEGQEVLDSLPRYTPVTLDIETSNPDEETIDPYTDQLLCFSLAWRAADGRERVVVFPRSVIPLCARTGEHVRAARAGVICPIHSCWTKGLSPWRWPTDVRWTFQNGPGDVLGIFTYFGVKLPIVDDTMLVSYCLDERPGYHGLKGMAREYLAAGWYNEKVKPYYKGRMHLLTDDALNEYNAKDAAYTLRMFTIMAPSMHDEGTDGLYRDLLLPASRTFTQMQARGIRVDRDKLVELAGGVWYPRYIDMTRALQLEAHAIGWPTEDINLNSSQQLGKLFYTIIGETIQKYTPGGAPSVDHEALEHMTSPFAAMVRDYRTLDKTLAYVASIHENLKQDNLLHPSAFVTTTRTGRTSYRDPAMQTIPKDYTVGADYARLREIILPHNSDTHVLVEADYNQIEVWLAWHHSQDPNLLDHLQSGDVHSATAEGAFKTTRDAWPADEWARKRQNAKKIRFGLQYGEGPSKLATPPPVGMGCSVYEAKQFISNFWATYPRHLQWVQRTQALVTSQGHIRSASGRVMRFPLLLDHKELRQAANFPIQADASDYNLTSMIELANDPQLAAFNSWVLLNIHDCLVVEADKRYLHEVVALMCEIMEKPRFPGYPSIKVDVKVGPNLGAMKKLEEACV